MSAGVVVFRTNGSATVGLGHIRRCLSLAKALHARGARCRFIVNQDDRALNYLAGRLMPAYAVRREEDANLRQTGAIAAELNAQALVIDSYDVTGESLRTLTVPIVAVLDDLADRFLPVTVVINGGLVATKLPYRVAPHTRLLLGPKYLLLRSEFARSVARATKPRVEQVLITVGGADTLGLTPRLVKWTLQSLPDARIDVVIGPFFADGDVASAHAAAALAPRVTLHEDPDVLPALMAESDLAIACGGQTIYELAATGTPTLAIRCADNQSCNLQALSAMGTLVTAGDARDPELHAAVTRWLARLASDVEGRAAMRGAARAVIDGLGAARVAQALLQRHGVRPHYEIVTGSDPVL